MAGEPVIVWYAQSAFRIEVEGVQLYLDPYLLPDGEPAADVIFLTHEHRDHCSPEDVAKIRTPRTHVVASPRAAEQLAPPVVVMRPGEVRTIDRLLIRTVPAYNLSKFRSPGVPYHPKEHEHVGFVFSLGGRSFYFAGDTDVIPEMEHIGPVDYAFLPVSGTFVMTADEAAEAVRHIRPRVVIPMHYGTLVGSVEDARRLAARVSPDVQVMILEPRGRRFS